MVLVVVVVASFSSFPDGVLVVSWRSPDDSDGSLGSLSDCFHSHCSLVLTGGFLVAP